MFHPNGSSNIVLSRLYPWKYLPCGNGGRNVHSRTGEAARSLQMLRANSWVNWRSHQLDDLLQQCSLNIWLNLNLYSFIKFLKFALGQFCPLIFHTYLFSRNAMQHPYIINKRRTALCMAGIKARHLAVTKVNFTPYMPWKPRKHLWWCWILKKQWRYTL